MALHIGIGNFAGAIASNVFRTQDAPRYIIGRAYPPLSRPLLSSLAHWFAHYGTQMASCSCSSGLDS